MKLILKLIWLILWWCKLLIFDIISFIWSFKLYHFRRCNNYINISYSPPTFIDQDVHFDPHGDYSNAYFATWYYIFPKKK